MPDERKNHVTLLVFELVDSLHQPVFALPVAPDEKDDGHEHRAELFDEGDRVGEVPACENAHGAAPSRFGQKRPAARSSERPAGYSPNSDQPSTATARLVSRTATPPRMSRLTTVPPAWMSYCIVTRIATLLC